MTLHERVTARLDEIEEAAVAFVRPTWTVEQYLPSLRRRVERHRPTIDEWCHRCGDDAPCPDYLDLCAELGINPGDDA